MKFDGPSGSAMKKSSSFLIFVIVSSSSSSSFLFFIYLFWEEGGGGGGGGGSLKVDGPIYLLKYTVTILSICSAKCNMKKVPVQLTCRNLKLVCSFFA
jgi:hypothetical protein